MSKSALLHSDLKIILIAYVISTFAENPISVIFRVVLDYPAYPAAQNATATDLSVLENL